MRKFALPWVVLCFSIPIGAHAQNFPSRHETVSPLKSNALPIFAAIVTSIPGVEYSSMAWGDYNNDGQLDILLTGLNAANQLVSKIYQNTGGSFVEIPANLAGFAQSDGVWGDYDNDGDLDVLLCGEGGASKIYRNNNGTFVDIKAPLIGVVAGAASWGDYDNDGDLDVLLTGRNEKSLAKIYRNDKGQFVDINAPLKGVSGGSARWGDYDNDGDLDILLTGFHENGIYVAAVYANERGIFSDMAANLPEVALSTGAWGDYDNDGDLDILVAGLTPALRRIAAVFRNNAGRFVDLAADLVGLEGGAEAWADYDNDGDLDALITGYSHTTSSSIAKIYQNDNGVFIGVAELKGEARSSFPWCDYDNDGDLDILLAGNSNSGFAKSVTILYRNDGTIKNTPPNPPSGLTSVIAQNAVTLRWNQGADNQTPQNGLTYNLRIGTSAGGHQIMSAMSRINGYRKIPEMGNVNHKRNWTIRNLPPGQYYWSVQTVDHTFAGSVFAPEQAFTITATNQPPVVINSVPALTMTLNDEPLIRNLYTAPAIFTDPDGDSLFYLAQSLAPEIARANIADGVLTITPVNQGMTTITLIARDKLGASAQTSFTVSVLGATQGPFTDIAAWLTGAGSSSAWGDYDNDGDLDILLTGATSSEYTQFISKVFRNDPAPGGRFFVDSGNSLIGVHGSSVAWGDYDNDGDLDILLAGWTKDAFRTDAPRATKIYRNDNGRFAEIMANLLGVGGGTVDWGDYDNDGDLDVLLTGLARDIGAATKIYRNDSGDHFVDINAPLEPAFRSAAVWGDYDNDGDLDILLAGEARGAHYGPITKIYQNNDGRFVDIGARLTGVYNCAAAWGDYDNDGDLDFLLSGFPFSGAEKTQIYRNDNGRFTDIGVALATVNEGTLAWGDYDNDGDLDVLLSRTSRIYKNDGKSFTEISASLPLSPIGTTNFGRGGSISWGDYDNDRDLDLLFTDFCGILACSKIYRNDTPKPNHVPVPPSGLVHIVSAYSATLRWGQASDQETVSPGLTYNLRVGVTPGGGEIVSPMSEASTGYRRVHKSGNMGHAKQWKIANLPAGKYYWSVQAIDPAYAGSVFAPEKSFIITSESVVIDPLQFDFGEVNIGANRDTALTIISRHAGSLKIFDVNIAGVDFMNFSFSGDTSFVLNNGERHTLPIRFQPRTLGNKIARVIIYHDGPEKYSFSTLAGTGVDLEPPVISGVRAPASIPYKTRLNVYAQVYDNNVVQQVRLLYRQGGQSDFGAIGMSLGDSSRYATILPDTIASIRGIEFDIEATDGINPPSRAGWRSVQVSLPDKFLQQTQTGGSSQNAYRLISVPLDSDDPRVVSTLLDDLGSPDIKKWRLWDIDPQRAHSLFPYREYPSVDDLVPGKAKFLITRDTKNLTSGIGKTARTVTPFDIQLQPGWNMIASPFNFAIPIDNVYPESLRVHFYTYNSGWTASVDLLKPWEGYVIKTLQPVILKILPFEGATGLPPPLSKFSDWSIQIEAACERARDDNNIVGILKDAALEWDRYERFEPPPIGDYVSLAFPHREWQRYADIYTSDFRPPVADGYVWDFIIDTNIPGKPVVLRFDHLESVPTDFEVRLVDVSLGLTQDLSREAQYTFFSKHDGGRKSFQLLVGKADFITAHSANLATVPATYELAQNFPNPFWSAATSSFAGAPLTSIKFGLPRKSRVSLKIYDLLGKEVVTLLDEVEKETGYHVAIWDGRDRQSQLVQSGVYFCRMQSGGEILIKKMTFIR